MLNRMVLAAIIICSDAISVAGQDKPTVAKACDLVEVRSSAKLRETLGRRAVEVVKRASQPGYRRDVRLSQLIEPSAKFGLGAGDVGRPLGDGLEGIRSLAIEMRPTSYRFDHWNYMDLATDGCGTQKVSVDFIDGPGKTRSRVEFTFRDGRMVSGMGWTGSIETGLLSPIEDRK